MKRKTPQEKLEQLRKDHEKLKKNYAKLHTQCVCFKGIVDEIATQLNKSVKGFYK